MTPDSHSVFKPTPLCTTYRLLCRCLYTSQCSHDKGFLRFQFPSSDQLCGSLRSQASGIWRPPAPLYCPPQGHTCRARPSQSGPGGKDARAWSEKPRPGPAGHTSKMSLAPHAVPLKAGVHAQSDPAGSNLLPGLFPTWLTCHSFYYWAKTRKGSSDWWTNTSIPISTKV